MKLKSYFIEKSPLRNFNYYFYIESTKTAFVWDPLDLNWYEEEFERLQPQKVILFNTHAHLDHIGQNEIFLKKFRAKEQSFKDGEFYQLDDQYSMKVMNTPGHIDPHLCYILYDCDKPIYLVSGDTLFNAGVGNCRLGGDPEVLFESIQKISQLDDDIIILPSHDYVEKNLAFSLSIEKENTDAKSFLSEYIDNGYKKTSLAFEKKINPFLRLKHFKQMSDFKDMTEKEIFVELRKRRDHF